MGERHHTNANTDPKGSKRHKKTTKGIQSISPGERLKGVLDNILFLVLDCLTQLSNRKRLRKSDLPSAHQPIDPSTHQHIQPSTHRPTDPSTSRQSIHSFCPARLATTTDQHGTPRRQTGIADKHGKPRCQSSTARQHGQPNSKLLAPLRNDDEVKNPPLPPDVNVASIAHVLATAFYPYLGNPTCCLTRLPLASLPSWFSLQRARTKKLFTTGCSNID